MRDLRRYDVYRCIDAELDRGIDQHNNRFCGVFQIPIKGAEYFHNVIATRGEGWDHVSVSYKDRCPTWEEMDAIKRMFFKPDEVVMQLHVAAEDHVNIHPRCLHLWRPTKAKIPLPPKEFV